MQLNHEATCASHFEYQVHSTHFCLCWREVLVRTGKPQCGGRLAVSSVRTRPPHTALKALGRWLRERGASVRWALSTHLHPTEPLSSRVAEPGRAWSQAGPLPLGFRPSLPCSVPAQNRLWTSTCQSALCREQKDPGKKENVKNLTRVYIQGCTYQGVRRTSYSGAKIF